MKDRKDSKETIISLTRRINQLKRELVKKSSELALEDLLDTQIKAGFMDYIDGRLNGNTNKSDIANMIISLLDDVKPTQLEFGGRSHGFTIRDISDADMRKILRIVATPILQEIKEKL